MKTHFSKLSIIALAIFVSALVVGCKSSEPSLSKEERIDKIIKSIEDRRYTFVPTSASPMGYRTINLQSMYSLKISKDSVIADLPYFGKSYSAPIDPRNIGINFTSTNFNYSVKQKKNSWDITIKTNDTRNNTQLYLSIDNSGYASLRVQENNRQGISYSGTVE